MKPVLFGILLLTGAFTAGAQAPSDITGKWKVAGITLTSEADELVKNKEGKDKMEAIEAAFLKSVFNFRPDQHFSFDFAVKDMQVKDAHWKYSEKAHAYLIQEWKDKDADGSVLMELSVRKEAGKVYFLMAETPFVLEVQKEK